jgi:hypothetical protein
MNSDSLEDKSNAIRIAILEETKHMSPQELNDDVHALTAHLCMHYKLTYISGLKEKASINKKTDLKVES